MNALSKRKENFRLRKKYNEIKYKENDHYPYFEIMSFTKDNKRIKRNYHKFSNLKKDLKREARRYNRRQKNYFDEDYTEELDLDVFVSKYYKPKKYIESDKNGKSKYCYSYHFY